VLGYPHRFAASLLCLSACLAQVSFAQDGATTTFDKVTPILKKRCGSCHGAERPRGGLDLSSLAGIKAGSTSGSVITAGAPDQSAIYTLAAHLDSPKMPPNSPKIPQRELDIIESWIAGGMADSTGKKMEAPVASMAAPSEEGSPNTQPEPRPLVEAVKPLSRPSAITAMDLRPRSTLLAISGEQQIVLLDAQSRETIKAFPFPEGEVFSLRFSRDGEQLIAAGGLGASEGIVVVFDVETGKRLTEIKEEGDAVLTADVSSSKDRLALGGSGKKIKLYSLPDQKLLATLTGYTDWVLNLKFSPDGLLLAGADRFGGVRVWEARTGKEFWVLRGHTGSVPALDWSPDANDLLTGGEDGTARIFSMHTGKQLKVFEPKLGGIQSAAWHNSGAIALAGRGRKAALLASDGITQSEFTLDDEATELAIDMAHKNIVVADAAGKLSTFSFTSGQPQAAFTLPLAPSAPVATTKWPSRTRAARAVTVAAPANTAATAESPDELAIAAKEAEEAVKATEASLIKLKENAARLQKLLNERNAAKP
jgi:hypothetical protein